MDIHAHPPTLLSTKFLIPRQPVFTLHRERLIDKLNTGVAGTLTLITAPTGFGKTSLATEWAAQIQKSHPKLRLAWLGLDQYDNDPQRFWMHFINALQPEIEPLISLGENLAALQNFHPN